MRSFTYVALLLAAFSASGEVAFERLSRFERFSTGEGLSQSSVNAVALDNQGFIWVATLGGLHRFDGYDFRVFGHDPEDPGSMSSNRIDVLLVDEEGHLWAGTDDAGLNHLNLYDERIVRHRHRPEDPTSLNDDRVQALHQDRQGRYWVGTAMGLDRLPNDEATAFEHVIEGDSVLAILVDRQGQLWVGTEDGLLLQGVGESQPERFRRVTGDPSSLRHDTVYSLLEDTAGNIWVGTTGALHRWLPESRTFEYWRSDDRPRSLGPGDVRSLHEAANALWVGVEGGGLFRVAGGDPNNGFEALVNDPQDPWSLSDDDVRAILSDGTGGLWIGTNGGGLNHMDLSGERFGHVQNDWRDRRSLAVNDVMAIHEGHSGTLWIGTDGGGVNRLLDGRPGDRPAFAVYRYRSGVESSLSNDRVYALWETRSGELWVGTRGGLNRIDRRGCDPATTTSCGEVQRYLHQPGEPASLAHDRVTSVYEDTAGRLWVGTYGGLDLYDPEQDVFIHHRHDPADPTSLADDRAMTIYEDRSGTLWVGTMSGGLNRLEWVDGRAAFESYQQDPADRTSLSHNFVRAIYEDQAGVLWVGTYGGGLNCLDRAQGTFSRYTERDGLINNTVYAILGDDSGRLWLSTNRGLTRFDPINETWTSFDVRDGLQNDEFNSGSAWHSQVNGKMYFGGINGFNVFDPQRFIEEQRAPPTFLTSFRILDKPSLKTAGLSYTKNFSLTYEERSFAFEFVGLHFRRPDHNQYRYRLEPFEKDWNDAGSRRYVRYTNIPPGDYTFRAEASNNGGPWSEESVKVALRIARPFWQSWWFRLLQVLTVLGALFLGFQIQRLRWARRQRLALEAHERQKEEELRQEELRRTTAELEMAREVQLALVPAHPVETAHVEVRSRMVTATEVGGDYYDVFSTGSSIEDEGEELYVVVGDAMGHGLAAGLVVGMAKAALVQTLRSLRPQSRPEELVRDLNKTLESSLPIRRIGLCLGIARLDPRSGHVEISSMGMPFPYHYVAAEQKLRTIELKGLPLGLWPKVDTTTAHVDLAQGDVLVLMSDGLPERQDEAGEIWGYTALEEELPRICAAAANADEIAQGLINACDAFAAGREPADDMTIVVVRMK